MRNIVQNKKVLVVDDEQGIIQIVEGFLERTTHKVISAINGEQGLAKAKLEKPHLILLDVSMPGIDGFEVLEKLRLDPETWHIPVIMLTAKGDTKSLLKTHDLGARDYLIKPFKGEDLLKCISKWV